MSGKKGECKRNGKTYRWRTLTGNGAELEEQHKAGMMAFGSLGKESEINKVLNIWKCGT